MKLPAKLPTPQRHAEAQHAQLHPPLAGVRLGDKRKNRKPTITLMVQLPTGER